MLREQIIKKYVTVNDVLYVIGHNGSIFLRSLLRTILFLVVLYGLYFLLNKYIVRDFLPWIFALLGAGFFVKYIIDFFNNYLDSLLLSKEWITLFTWDGILHYKTDFFARNTIETVSYVHNSIWDKVFSKWDIMIKLDHEIEYPFENVSRPQKQMAKILKFKEQYAGLQATKKEEIEVTDEKISILAEALGEVVKEYLDKKESEKEEDY